MSSLAEFNDTLASLEKEANKLEDVTGAYAKIAALVSDYERIQNLLTKSVTSMQGAQQELEAQEKMILEKIASIKGLQESARKNLEELLSDRISLMDEAVEKMRKQNKEFYIDLERTLKIKLEENLSELKRLMESESQKFKQAVEQAFEQHANLAAKRHKNTLLILGGITGLILIAEVLSLFKIL